MRRSARGPGDRTRLALLAGALLVAAGCGAESGIWLEVDAPFLVPSQCDGLQVTVNRGDATGPVIYDQRFALDGGSQFPETLALQAPAAADVGVPLLVTAKAYLGASLAQPWSQASQAITLEHGKVAAVTLPLVNPGP